MALSKRTQAYLALGWVAYLLLCIVLTYFEFSFATPMMAVGVIPPLLVAAMYALVGR